MPLRAHAGAYSDSSAAGGLTSRERAWFSAAMTQRNIHRPRHDLARRTARASVAVRTEGIPANVLTAAIAALVLVVVVLITTPTGAG